MFALCFGLSKIAAEAQMSKALGKATPEHDGSFHLVLQAIMRTIEVGLSNVYEVSSRVSVELRDSDGNFGSNFTGKRLRELITTKMSSMLGKLEILSALLEIFDLNN